MLLGHKLNWLAFSVSVLGEKIVHNCTYPLHLLLFGYIFSRILANYTSTTSNFNDGRKWHGRKVLQNLFWFSEQQYKYRDFLFSRSKTSFCKSNFFQGNLEIWYLGQIMARWFKNYLETHFVRVCYHGANCGALLFISTILWKHRGSENSEINNNCLEGRRNLPFPLKIISVTN